MDVRLQIISNIIVPSITGIFFFIYFAYFAVVKHSRAPSFFYFMIFLFSFSLFLLGRPLQLVLGRHPVQLITVNIRMLIFTVFSITSITIASNLFSGRNSLRTRGLIYAAGTVLGIIYIVFNTLGTTGSMPVFDWGGLQAFDALTPAMRAPFYGREVTIAVQGVIGVLLLLNSSFNLIIAGSKAGFAGIVRDKAFLFNSGVLLFALTFIIGSLTKQWWIYYFFSMFSALLFGAGVVIDIRELHNNYERLVPIIKEDIIQNVAFSSFSQQKLRELLRCIGKTEELDTFAVLGFDSSPDPREYRRRTIETFTILDKAEKVLHKSLDVLVGSRNYIIIPLDEIKIGLALNLLSNPSLNAVHSVDLFEKVQAELCDALERDVPVGIGRSYESMEDLRTSYYDALNALEYAEKFSPNALIHVNNIQHESESTVRFPVKEKMQLMAALKMGDREGSLQTLTNFLEEFHKFIARRPEALKLRLYELAGSLIDNAILVGGDEEQLNRLVKESFNDIKYLTSFKRAKDWLTDLVERLIHFVTHIQKSRAVIIIDKAREIIDERFAGQISYHEVARELCISSSYFQALFKQELGCTFVEYLTERRISHARELLLGSNMTITEISYEIGISNPNYFSSIFKKFVGISAKEFRKRRDQTRV